MVRGTVSLEERFCCWWSPLLSSLVLLPWFGGVATTWRTSKKVIKKIMTEQFNAFAHWLSNPCAILFDVKAEISWNSDSKAQVLRIIIHHCQKVTTRVPSMRGSRISRDTRSTWILSFCRNRMIDHKCSPWHLQLARAKMQMEKSGLKKIDRSMKMSRLIVFT